MKRNWSALAMAAALALGLFASSASERALAQPRTTAAAPVDPFANVPRQGCARDETTQTELGWVLRQSCALPALGQEDYGRVEIEFTPPPAAAVIKSDELRQTLGSRFSRRFFTDVRSATLVLDVSLRGVGGDVKLATVPLTTYDIDERGKLVINTTRQFRDGPITAYFPIADNQTVIAVSTRLAFSQQRRGELITQLQQFAGVAADFGGHGWAINALANDNVRQRLQGIEQLFVGAGQQVTESNTVDLRYAPEGFTRVTYRFGLDPRTINRFPLGSLSLRITRSASVFTNGVANGRVNYNITSADQYDRFLDYAISSQADIRAFLATQDGSATSEFANFNSAASTPAVFESACGQVWRRLDMVGASGADRRALFWALLAQTENGARRELWQANSCLSQRRASSANFGLLIPDTTSEEPIPPVAITIRDDWFSDTVIPIIALPPSSPDRYRSLTRLFAPSVNTDFEPNTVFPASMTTPVGSESPESLARLLTEIPIRLGCRFEGPAAASGVQGGQQMGFLVKFGRPTDADEVMTAIIRYQGRRAGGNPVISGLAIRRTTEADWTAIRGQAVPRPECRSAETAFPAVRPPSTPATPAAPASPATTPAAPPRP